VERTFDDPRTHVILESIRGDLVQEIVGQHIRIANLNGWVRGEATKVAHGKVALHIGEDTLRTRVDYFDRNADKLKIHIERKQGVAATTSSWLLQLVDEFSDAISVDG
jgi:hypothetical protein